MILDTLAHHSLYHRLDARHACSFAWLTGFSTLIPDGRYEIDGQDVFALVQSYTTAPAVEKKYEAHRHYLDIQYLAEGAEVIQYAPVSALKALTEYNAEKDFQLYSDPAAPSALHLSTGSFALFYPQDGHKPGCIAGTTGRIKKVVIKVRL
jgi:YhcH/YjgK/YiaL family protein